MIGQMPLFDTLQVEPDIPAPEIGTSDYGDLHWSATIQRPGGGERFLGRVGLYEDTGLYYATSRYVPYRGSWSGRNYMHLYETPELAAAAALRQALAIQPYFAEIADAYGPKMQELYVVEFNFVWEEISKGERPESYWSWDELVRAGHSYMVGDSVPVEKYVRDYTTPLTAWMKPAARLAWSLPRCQIVAITPTSDYKIYWACGFVAISLPHQDRGGEKDWGTRDFEKRLLYNVD